MHRADPQQIESASVRHISSDMSTVQIEPVAAAQEGLMDQGITVVRDDHRFALRTMALQRSDHSRESRHAIAQAIRNDRDHGITRPLDLAARRNE